METSTSLQISVCEILERFPLDFIPDIKQSDKDLIVSSVKAYKNLESDTLTGSFNFLEPREIRIISEFFSRYGPQIRYTISLTFKQIRRILAQPANKKIIPGLLKSILSTEKNHPFSTSFFNRLYL
jgi:hypothetical protein